MKKFTFNLETVLKVRKQREEAAQRDMVKALKRLESLKEILKLLQDEVYSLEEELQQRQKHSPNVRDFYDYLLYLQSVKKKIEVQQDEVFKAHNIMEERRSVTVAAQRQKKVIENIKDKHYDEWSEHLLKTEQKFLDELATIRYIREKEGKKDES
jgi:flagellar protein FliJ